MTPLTTTAPSSLRFIPRDMAMDLGTANTLIYMKGRGIVLNEPSVVAYDLRKEEVLAVGNEAKSYLGRTPKNIKAIRPLKDGVIADFTVTRTMIREFFLKVQKLNRFLKPKAVICVPIGITQVEKKAILEAAEEAGAGRVHLIEEPMAAAIGAGLDINQVKGQMVIDIGGGTTEVAVLSRGAVVCSQSIRVAGDEINEAIINFLAKMHSLEIGENMAEECKIGAGSAFAMDDLPPSYTVAGKDMVENRPKEVKLSSEEIRVAVREPVMAVVETVNRLLSKTPPELQADVTKDGITMAGGGSLLRGMHTLVEQETGIPCRLTDDPLTSVVMGSGMALENLKEYRKVFIS